MSAMMPFQTLKNTENSLVVVVDYGLGNLRSLVGAVERVGYPVIVSNKAEDIRSATKLILPGVGAFGDGMKNLRSLNLVHMLREAVFEQKKPILGICLGCQLFATEGTEFGRHQGLGWIDGTVIKIEPSDPRVRVPHVGWDQLEQLTPDPLFANIPSGALFYYVHSYFMQSTQSNNVVGRCDYGVPMSVAFHQENIYGVQFHPEKSQLHGLVLLRNFLDL